jgi:hypothetical protein
MITDGLRATWIPLLVFAAVTFASISVSRYSGHHAGTCAAVPEGRICAAYSTGMFVYWPIALVLAYVAIAAFYIRRSRARGVGTRVRPYVIAGIIVAVAVTGAALWEVHNPTVGGRSPLGLPGLLPPAGQRGLRHRARAAARTGLPARSRAAISCVPT